MKQVVKPKSTLTQNNKTNTTKNDIKTEKVNACPIGDLLKECGSGILDFLQFALDWGGVFGGNTFGTICDIVNSLISLARNEVVEFVVGIVGVCFPFIAAATIKKMAKAEGYHKIIKYILDKVDNASEIIVTEFENFDKWCLDQRWIPKNVKKGLSTICEKTTDFINKIFDEVKEKRRIDISDYLEISQKSIHNESSNKVMLGKFVDGGPESYIQRAGTEYTYFDLGKEWDEISKEYNMDYKEMFEIFNRPFLDDGIYKSKTFYFSHNPIGDNGSLSLEYKYLLANNYEWNPENMSMTKILK